MRRAMLLAALIVSAVACSIEERGDFLIGRQCDENDPDSCDLGQACLPHAKDADYRDYRCRDRESFEPLNGQEPPLAYCDPARNLLCPGDLVCNADRIRADGAARPLVCKRDDDVFAPPLDGGV